jgi:hypothetical protein
MTEKLPTDFNDRAQLAGKAAVKADIDAATTPPETDQEAFARLAKLSRVEYDRVRDSEAKRLNIRSHTLDNEVTARRPKKANHGLNGEAQGKSLSQKPVIELPSGHVTISEAAENLFGLIAPTKTLFMRGGAIVTPVRRDDGLLALDILRPAAARSFFEKFARLFAWRSGSNGEVVLKPTTCPQEMAEALLHTKEARTLLPHITGLINCPIIREINGQAIASGVGYDVQTQVLVTGGKKAEEVDLKTAIHALIGLLDEFDFQTDGDGARAIASVISPALKMGGFIKGRVPADVAEADQSQSGKTFRQKLIAAIYNEKVSLVTSREGGVGSVDESLNQQLIAGRPFIQFDNFRGRFDSAHLEAFLTAEGSFPCRVPHRSQVTVPPESYFVLLTSNGVNTTRDFANRSNIIRIRKKPPGFSFHEYPEGNLLEHIRVNQAHYLGCVFAVVHYWHAQGKPRTAETRHDFREWVQVVDWIVQNVFHLVPVMDGHQQAQERVSNPAMVWLRSVALAIDQTGDLGRELIATEIYSICESSDISIPGLRDGADQDKAVRVIGTVMAKLFRDGDTIKVDSYEVVREERYVPRDNGSDFKSKTYTVRKQ